ncbi:MAG: hypothetical protein FD127_3358 [Acidimicrobiaceae bacterium]|nr:MAG: hypothetical protein FD127_3358 [Acidimicrobiaceae bacterium]
MTPSGRIGQGVLYGVFGVLLVVGGWFVGWLYGVAESNAMAAFGAIAWWMGLLAMPLVLAAVFMVRPLRSLHRYAWAATAAVAVFGFLRSWNLTWSLISAGVVGAAMAMPRRSRWSWQ